MLDIPGTLFIVRKKTEFANSTGSTMGPGYVIGWSDQTNKLIYVPYGSVVLLLSLKPTTTNHRNFLNKSRQTQTFDHELKILWEEKIINVYGTPKSFDRWFALPSTWKKHGHEAMLEKYKQNGFYEKLNKIIKK